jgi:serine/threonine-protein kinase HipA
VTNTVEIYIDQGDETVPLGICRYVAKRRGQSSVFEYDARWLKRKSAFAVDPQNLPLQSGPIYTSSEKSALPGAMRDSAPDRWGQQLIKRAFRKAGAERALSEIDYLLAMTDLTRIGALRYRREGESDFDHDIGHYRVPPLIQLPALVNAADAVQTNTETAQDLKLLLNEGSPLGGARPKSAVVDEDGSLAIAKFPKLDDDRSIPHGEVLAMTLARKAGLTVPDTRLLEVAGRPVALIKRFDRRANQRIPFLSAMSLLGLNDGDDAT